MSTEPQVLIIATMDTKFREALFLKACIEAQGVGAIIMDAGIKGESPAPVHITREEVAQAAGKRLTEVQGLKPEGIALNVMITGAKRVVHDLLERNMVSGIIGLGGSMGTTLGTAVMKALPIGFPKVMISTMASRNTRPFVGTKDIMMLHSVCDLAGLNRITRPVLRNGALALAGMVKGKLTTTLSLTTEDRPLIAMSTLGTTEACVAYVREQLEQHGKEVVTFHTVGAGGQAMDELIDRESVEFVVEVSLHELVDHLFGGDYDAGPERATVSINKGVPTILIPGNTDFLVTGPVEVAKKTFPDRPFHIHNSAITAVRTSRDELVKLADFMAGLYQKATGPVAFAIPLGGFSAFDSPGSPLEDRETRYMFRDALKDKLPPEALIFESTKHINDPEFARLILDIMREISNGLHVNR